MEITAGVVKQLREKTGVGMMECKSALVEAKGDMAEAEKILRKKGLAAAANKAGRATGEGVIAACIGAGERSGVLVEINCETDFAARGADFQTLVREIAEHVAAAAPADPEALLDQPLHGVAGKTVRQRLGEAVGKIGENIQVRRFVRFDASADPNGRVGSYIHTGSKIGVLVEAEVRPGAPEAGPVLRDVAMQVAAASPRFVRREEVSEKVLADEREIARDQALKAGKPPAVVDKIVVGRMEKFFGEACLLEQSFVKDQDKTVAAVIGPAIVIRRFARFVLGEGA